MVERPDIYELLAQQQTSATTQEQLNKAAQSTFIDKSNIEFWSGIITVARAIGESRTFAHGLPIYNTSTIFAPTIADGANQELIPTGTEVWQVMNIDPSSCEIYLRGTTGASRLSSSSLATGGPLYLTADQYILIINGSGGSQSPTVAYVKVSL